MAAAKLRLATAPLDSFVRSGSHSTLTVRALQGRLEYVERELRLQFTRIAQLQAELDLMAGAQRHPHGGAGRPTGRR